MVVLGVLFPIAILGLLALGAALLFRRGGEGIDLGPRSLLRFYLFIASLAGILTLVIGLSGILNAGFAAAFGNGFVYGAQPLPANVRPCPPNQANVKCPEPPIDYQGRQSLQEIRRNGEDLIRGVTFTVFGALFWAAHWAARRGAIGTDEGFSGRRRAYLLCATVIFGRSTIVMPPRGIYPAPPFLCVSSPSHV